MRACNNARCRGKKLPAKGRHSCGCRHRNRDSHIGLFSAFDAFFAITRQSVPLKANGKLRFAEDEGYIRIF